MNRHSFPLVGRAGRPTLFSGFFASKRTNNTISSGDGTDKLKIVIVSIIPHSCFVDRPPKADHSSF